MAEQEGPTVRQRAARLIRDSGRFLLKEVKAAKDSGKFIVADVAAALREARDPSAIFERWRGGERELKQRELDLNQLVQDAVSECSATCAELGVSLELEQGAHFPALLLDELRLRAVVITLLQTSLHFLGRDATARIEAEGERARIGLRAGDEAGKPLGGLRRLLETEDSELAIARDIVAAHGGELTITDELLSLALPRARREL